MNVDVERSKNNVLALAHQQKFEDPSKLLAVATKTPGIQDAVRRIVLNIISSVVIMYGMLTFFNSDAYLEILDTSGQIKLIKSYGTILTYVLTASNHIATRFPAAFNTINAVVPAYSTTLLHRLLFSPTETIRRYRTGGLGVGNAAKMGSALLGGAMLNALPAGGGMIIGPQLTKAMIYAIKQLKDMNNKNARRAYLTATVVVGGRAQYVRQYVEDVTRTAIRQGLVSVISVLTHNTFETAKGFRNLAMVAVPRGKQVKKLGNR
tara:strand:- start:54 stop:845 length:792 start_codon:yes stop_codon:yes gene_type:complete